MPATESIPSFEPFEAMVVSYDDAPDECTIYPRDVQEDQETTAWITAQEGSFCSVEAHQ